MLSVTIHFIKIRKYLCIIKTDKAVIFDKIHKFVSLKKIQMKIGFDTKYLNYLISL